MFTTYCSLLITYMIGVPTTTTLCMTNQRKYSIYTLCLCHMIIHHGGTNGGLHLIGQNMLAKFILFHDPYHALFGKKLQTKIISNHHHLSSLEKSTYAQEEGEPSLCNFTNHCVYPYSHHPRMECLYYCSIQQSGTHRLHHCEVLQPNPNVGNIPHEVGAQLNISITKCLQVHNVHHTHSHGVCGGYV